MLFSSAFVTANAENTDEVVKIMPLGDSITDGYWLTGGYRTTLYNNLKENGYADSIDLVGPNWGGDGDPNHAGYSGYSIDNIEQADSISGQRTGISSFADWLMENHPADVVLLQIGTNDILSYYDLDNITIRLENLVNQLLKYIDEDGMIYIATIPCMDATNTLYISEYYFTVDSMDAIVDKYNSEIKEMVSRLQTEGKNVAFSDINSCLDKSDLYDGVHPNESGYKKMGDYWYGVVKGYLDGETSEETTTTTEITTSETTETTTTEIIETTVTTTTEITETTTSEPVKDIIKGDINNNGNIDCFDFVILKNTVISGTKPYTENSDMNDDGVINVADIIILSNKILDR